MYAVHTEVALVGGSDSVGKTDSCCVSKMVTVVVKPAGMWQLVALKNCISRTFSDIKNRSDLTYW